MPVGLLLQSLLKSLFLPPPPSPIPSSSISLNVRGRSCSVFIRFLWLIFSLGPDEEPFTPLSKPYSRGQCQDAPGGQGINQAQQRSELKILAVAETKLCPHQEIEVIEIKNRGEGVQSLDAVAGDLGFL